MPETNQVSDPSQNLEPNKELFEDLSLEQMFKKFSESREWQIIKASLDLEIESFKEQLVLEQDVSKIPKVQAAIAALRFIPKLLEDIFLKGNEARHTLETITEYNKTLI